MGKKITKIFEENKGKYFKIWSRKQFLSKTTKIKIVKEKTDEPDKSKYINFHIRKHHVWVLSRFSGVWLFCYPRDCSPPGSSVHGILQARILEGVAISFSRGSFPLWDWTCVSCVSCIGRQILYHEYHLGSPSLAHLKAEDWKVKRCYSGGTRRGFWPPPSRDHCRKHSERQENSSVCKNPTKGPWLTNDGGLGAYWGLS